MLIASRLKILWKSTYKMLTKCLLKIHISYTVSVNHKIHSILHQIQKKFPYSTEWWKVVIHVLLITEKPVNLRKNRHQMHRNFLLIKATDFVSSAVKKSVIIQDTVPVL